MNLSFYKLVNKKVVLCSDVMEWDRRFECENRAVNFQLINGDAVSTIFIGLDHSCGQEQPLVFETRVFGGVMDGATMFHATWTEAEIEHDYMVNKVQLHQGTFQKVFGFHIPTKLKQIKCQIKNVILNLIEKLKSIGTSADAALLRLSKMLYSKD